MTKLNSEEKKPRTSSRLNVKPLKTLNDQLCTPSESLDKRIPLLKRKHKREWIKRGLNCNWTSQEVNKNLSKIISNRIIY